MEKKLKFIWVLTLINSTLLFAYTAILIWGMFHPTPNTDLGKWVENNLNKHSEWVQNENQKTRDWVEGSLKQQSDWVNKENQSTKDWTEEQLDNNWKSLVEYINNRMVAR